MQHDSNHVLDVDPWHPLPAASEPATHSQSKWRKHPGQRSAIRSQNDADAHADHANPELRCQHGFAFPIHTDLGQKASAGRRVLIQLFITAVAVVAHCGCRN